MLRLSSKLTSSSGELYLDLTKLQFLYWETKVLGGITNDHSIRMDPNRDKVDSVLNWNAPTSKDLLREFLGSVGYVADNISTVRIPIGILASLMGANTLFTWGFTHQRAE